MNDSPTIFDLLEDAGKTWNIFCRGWLLESFTLMTQKHRWKYALTKHFAHFKDFVVAAGKKGGLPSYSFIEPIYFDSIAWGPENDMHPECILYQFYGPSNLHRGEVLIATIYKAIRNSPDWESTLLIILFDEHGGCYDHVPPPFAPECKVAIATYRVIPAREPGGHRFQIRSAGTARSRNRRIRLRARQEGIPWLTLSVLSTYLVSSTRRYPRSNRIYP